MKICYNSPKWIRHLGKLLEEVPLDAWKVFLQRCYIINSIKFLPAPYSDIYFEFFGKCVEGQKVKNSPMKTLVNILYDYCPDSFSELFWDRHGSATVLQEVTQLCKNLTKSACMRIKSTEWLEKSTRLAGIEKIRAMKLSVVRPARWEAYKDFPLNSENLLENVLTLGNRITAQLFSRIDRPYRFWEEGIYRVNAYYFNENNEIMIPYATTYSPYYLSEGGAKSIGWNYGSLGSIIGHEICHGFDVEGKEYDWKGEKRKWWTRRDNLAYNHRTKVLISLYDKDKMLGKRIDGKLTLSENIADLGGVGISLQGLKEELIRRSITQYSDIICAYRDFFIAYATSWRAIYRDKKLRTSIGIDRHAPASLRVNHIVSQFDEWYEAFEIDSDSELYRKPEDRIRIF